MKRLPHFDLLKLVAIFMVVWGHVQGLFVKDGEFIAARNFIEGVNMPLFFAISGCFLVKPIREMNVAKIAKTIVRYVYPLIVISLVFSSFRLAVASPLECLVYGFVVFKSYWFIWSLVLCILIAFIVSVIAQKMSRVMGVLCGLAIFAVLMIPTASTVMIRTVHFAPFFLFGCISGVGGGLYRFCKLGMLSAVCYILVVFLAGDFHTNGLSYYANDFVWNRVLGSPYVVVYEIGRAFIGVIGIVGFVSVCKAMMDKWRGIERISFLGTTTLGVYLLHWPLMPYLTRIVRSLNGTDAFSRVIHIALVSSAVFAVCHCVTYYTMKYRVTRRFLWMVG